MKNTKIIWRLKEQPTSESLRELVKDKILTNEEARQILFTSETEEERDKSSLEAEIKFLREVVDKLSADRNHTIQVIKQIPYKTIWYSPYQDWCSTSGTNALSLGSYFNSSSN